MSETVNPVLKHLETYSCGLCAHYKLNERNDMMMCVLYAMCKAEKPLLSVPSHFRPKDD